MAKVSPQSSILSTTSPRGKHEKPTLIPSRKRAFRMNLTGVILALFSLTTTMGESPEDFSNNGSAGTDAQDRFNFLSPTRGILPKTVVSSNLRLVFLVGLEGSGHHYFVEALHHFRDGQQAQQTGCKSMYKSLEVELAMRTSPSTYDDNIEKARIQMRNLAKHGLSLYPEDAVVNLCGRYSYPTNAGPGKVFQYIDLGTLADLAEQEGVDLRVIYLKRSAHDIAISTTVHRHFYKGTGIDNVTESFMLYMRILMTDIAVMHSFLAGLDPSFVECHDFDYLGGVDQATRIAEHIAPKESLVDKVIALLLEKAPEPSSEKEPLKFEGADFVVSRLQRHLDSYEFMYCPSR